MKNQKLKKSCTLMILVMFSFLAAKAQIVYTDVNPDDTVGAGAFTFNNDTLALDLNSDLVSDFYFITHDQHAGCGSGWHGTQIASAKVNTNTNAFVALDSGLTLKLNYGQTIDSNLMLANSFSPYTLRRYTATGNPCSGIGTDYGNWVDSVGVDFLPVKINVSGNNYYGWIKLRVYKTVFGLDRHFSIIVQGYAYNSIANQYILAGDTGLGSTGTIENIASSSIFLYPNPATNHFTITFPISNKKAAITITDITGKLIYSNAVTETQKIEVNTKDFAEGIYIVRIQTAEFTETKKLFITN